MDDQKTVRIDDVTLETGKLVQGRYKLAGMLGSGGFAKVFEAFDTNIERPVAIKFLDLHRSLSDPTAAEEVLARFEREAKLAARIEHPNVVNIYDYGLLGSGQTVPFIVMERLSGHDLAQVLAQDGAMSAERALPLFAGCLDALGKAHRESIVHKDIKPANLFVSNPGERDEALRLVDFGIAHIKSAAEARLTRTGEVLGTPQYFAPEYIADQSVSPALDVYQMGLVLVEMLSGRPVVDLDNSLLCMRVHSSGEIEVPVGLMDSALGPVIRKALARDAAKRFADGYAFADALREIDPSSIPPVPAQALMCRLGAEGDSHEIVGGPSTEDFNRPTQPATPVAASVAAPGAANAIGEAPTVGLPADTQARETETSEGEGPSSRQLLLVAILLGLLVMGGAIGALALSSGGGSSKASNKAKPADDAEAVEAKTADDEAKKAAEEPADPKPDPKTDRREANKPAAAKAPQPRPDKASPDKASPDRANKDKASRKRAKKQREREKRERERRERRREHEKNKLKRRLEKKLEEKAKKEAEKGLESLGL